MAQTLSASKFVLYLRSGLFLLLLALSAMVYATLGLLTFLLPFERRYRLLTTWGGLGAWLCVRICGLNYRVMGLQNIPDRPCVILASHQSTWETLVLSRLFPPLTWVVKRELTWIPFFGWGLAMIEPIVIDRRVGKRASQQLVQQGCKRLNQGRWVLVFPQGTRVLPGEQRRYKLGGALLAATTGVPVVPVAHNAGDFWPRHKFIKHPGMITICVGPAVDSLGKSPQAINAEVEAWISATEVSIRIMNSKQA
jgi:1-acyl-sn-glycerol-3-phosphate acyltransferase